MLAYQADAESHGATVALNASVVSADVSGTPWKECCVPLRVETRFLTRLQAEHSKGRMETLSSARSLPDPCCRHEGGSDSAT